MRFNKYDIHEWNISKEKYLEMTKDFSYKVDANPHELQSIHIDAMSNLRRDAEQSFVLTKMEITTPEELKELTNKEKSERDRFYETALIIYFINEIRKEALKTYSKAKEIRMRYEASNDFLKSKEEDNQRKIISDTALSQAIANEQARREVELKNYISGLEANLNNWKKELVILKERKQQLEAEMDNVFKINAKAISYELYTIKGTDGKPALNNCSQYEKENFVANVMKRYHNTAREIKNEKEIIHKRISQIDVEIEQLNNKVNSSRRNTEFSASKDGSLTVQYSSQRNAEGDARKVDGLQKEKEQLQSKLIQLELKEEARNKEDVLQALNDANIADEHRNIPSDFHNQIKSLTGFKNVLDEAEAIQQELDENEQLFLDAINDMDNDLNLIDDNFDIYSGVDGFDDLLSLKDEMSDLRADFAAEIGLNSENVNRASMPF